MLRFPTAVRLRGVGVLIYVDSRREPRAETPMFEGGNGSSLENAVVILGATSESAGVKAEHTYLSRHFPGSAVVRQALLHQAGKVFDRLEIRTPTNTSAIVYFDITDFFGKS
jgi:hypothetical protein